MSEETKIVALSGGKDSTALALRLAEVEPGEYRFCITPTGRELPTMAEHWRRLESLLGRELIKVPGPTLLDLIIKFKALPNFQMRWCTRLVKIEPFIAYASSVAPAVCLVGIRADEAEQREGTNWNGIEGVRQDFPLVRWGWGLGRVVEYLRERQIEIPMRTDCDWCFYQRLAEWWRLWRDWPEKWKEGEAVEAFTGHTFRSDGRDSWPASMKDMRHMFERGLVPKDAAQQEIKLDSGGRKTMCAWCAR